ncbi:MAG: DUF86 domain-containing protein [Spirochaetes bacterium]|nr:DUF86 domain-containing protein [Spirochaetota bacterium]
MYDKGFVRILLTQIYDALHKIKERTEVIKTSDDFISSEQGEEKLDSICVLFMAIGENLKKIDTITEKSIFSKYPEIDWDGFKGFRDIIAHQYFNIDEEMVFSIIKNELPQIIIIIKRILDEDLK